MKLTANTFIDLVKVIIVVEVVLFTIGFTTRCLLSTVQFGWDIAGLVQALGRAAGRGQ